MPNLGVAGRVFRGATARGGAECPCPECLGAEGGRPLDFVSAREARAPLGRACQPFQKPNRGTSSDWRGRPGQARPHAGRPRRGAPGCFPLFPALSPPRPPTHALAPHQPPPPSRLSSYHQVRSHAQKYFLKLEKEGRGAMIPPARPKRKPEPKGGPPGPSAAGSQATGPHHQAAAAAPTQQQHHHHQAAGLLFGTAFDADGGHGHAPGPKRVRLADAAQGPASGSGTGTGTHLGGGGGGGGPTTTTAAGLASPTSRSAAATRRSSPTGGVGPALTARPTGTATTTARAASTPSPPAMAATAATHQQQQLRPARPPLPLPGGGSRLRRGAAGSAPHPATSAAVGPGGRPGTRGPSNGGTTTSSSGGGSTGGLLFDAHPSSAAALASVPPAHPTAAADATVAAVANALRDEQAHQNRGLDGGADGSGRGSGGGSDGSGSGGSGSPAGSGGAPPPPLPPAGLGATRGGALGRGPGAAAALGASAAASPRRDNPLVVGLDPASFLVPSAGGGGGGRARPSGGPDHGPRRPTVAPPPRAPASAPPVAPADDLAAIAARLPPAIAAGYARLGVASEWAALGAVGGPQQPAFFRPGTSSGQQQQQQGARAVRNSGSPPIATATTRPTGVATPADAVAAAALHRSAAIDTACDSMDDYLAAWRVGPGQTYSGGWSVGVVSGGGSPGEDGPPPHPNGSSPPAGGGGSGGGGANGRPASGLPVPGGAPLTATAANANARRVGVYAGPDYDEDATTPRPPS